MTTPKTTRSILDVIARFARKTIRFAFQSLAAVILAALILALLLPPAAFAWRSTRPLNDPLFNSLSFYQVTRLRYSQYQVFTTHYNLAHPADAVIQPEECFWVEVARSATNGLISEVCTLWPKCRNSMPLVPTSLGSYPAAFWADFEAGLVYEFNRAPQQPVGACRLPPSFPPP